MKKAECQRIDAFELWCWRRLLRVPWTARRSNQSILKETSPGISLEGIMLKLKLHYFGHLVWRVDPLKWPWFWEGLGTGEEGDNRGWDGWMASLTRWTWVSVNSGSWWWTGRPGVLRFMGWQRVGHDWATDLSVLKKYFLFFFLFLVLKAILKGNQQVSQFPELYSCHLTAPESSTVYSVCIIKLNKIQSMVLVYIYFSLH